MLEKYKLRGWLVLDFYHQEFQLLLQRRLGFKQSATTWAATFRLQTGSTFILCLLKIITWQRKSIWRGAVWVSKWLTYKIGPKTLFTTEEKYKLCLNKNVECFVGGFEYNKYETGLLPKRDLSDLPQLLVSKADQTEQHASLLVCSKWHIFCIEASTGLNIGYF